MSYVPFRGNDPCIDNYPACICAMYKVALALSRSPNNPASRVPPYAMSSPMIALNVFDSRNRMCTALEVSGQSVCPGV